MDDLNAQARLWCEGPVLDRRLPEDSALSVGEAFNIERASLLALPERDYPLRERVAVSVGKTPYVRFDLNDYSVPYTHVRRTLGVLADERRVRIFDGTRELAAHPRSWDRGAQIEDTSHVQALVDHKRGARAHRACDHLAQAAPASAELLKRAGLRGHNLGSITAALMRLLQRYGAAALQAAMLVALERDVPHPNAVRLARWMMDFREASTRCNSKAANEHGVLAGRSPLVVAPTSSGKTMIGELAAIQAVTARQEGGASAAVSGAGHREVRRGQQAIRTCGAARAAPHPSRNCNWWRHLCGHPPLDEVLSRYSSKALGRSRFSDSFVVALFLRFPPGMKYRSALRPSGVTMWTRIGSEFDFAAGGKLQMIWPAS